MGLVGAGGHGVHFSRVELPFRRPAGPQAPAGHSARAPAIQRLRLRPSHQRCLGGLPKATGARFVERDDIGDALDFIGWYNDRSHRKLGIAKTDAYRLYLAYYSGPTGYAKGTWRRDQAVQGYARKVADRTARYAQQLRRCEGRLKKRWRWF